MTPPTDEAPRAPAPSSMSKPSPQKIDVRYWAVQLALLVYGMAYYATCRLQFLLGRREKRETKGAMRLGVEGHLMGRMLNGKPILSGVERFVQELLPPLCASPDVAKCTLYSHFSYEEPRCGAKFVNVALPRMSQYHRRILRDIARRDVDVFYLPHVYQEPVRMLPVWFAPVSLVTVHDIIPLLWEGYLPPLNRWVYRAMLSWCCRRATAVVVDSESTRRDLQAHFRVQAERVHVVPLGVEARFQPITDEAKLSALRERYNLPTAYVLTLSRPFPHKNIPFVIRAMALLKARFPDLPDLVLAGPTDNQAGNANVTEAIREAGAEAWAHRIGMVDEEDLPALYSGATLFAFPSLYEGFGLPPLEAMACGTPVVSSQSASLPEVVGDAGILADAGDVDAFADALRRVLQDKSLRAVLTAKGLAQAQRFRWDVTAQQLIALSRRLRNEKL